MTDPTAAAPEYPAPMTPATELRRVERPSPLTGVAYAWLAIVALAIFVGRELIEGDWKLTAESDLVTPGLILLAVVALIALCGLGIGFIQWRTTTFIVDHEFRIERRFITTRTSRIDFTKVQSVDITRPLAARVLGLAEVTIDVGGEGGQRLRFLSKARAETLRDVLLEKMAGTPSAPGDADPQAPTSTPGEVVYRANPASIALGAVLSFGLTGVVIVAILLAVFFGPFGAAAGATWLWLGVVGALWQIPKQLITNWGFTIERTPSGLRIQRGAFTRVQTTLRPQRVQTISLHQSLFMRWAGLVTVQLAVLGNKLGDEEGTGINVLMPFGRPDEARHVVSLIWPDVSPAALSWRPQAPKGRWLTWAGRRWWALERGVVATRSTFLSNTVQVVPLERIQGLGVSVGPLQRLAGVASCDVHTIDGAPDLDVSHLLPQDARGLFEELRRRSAAARAEPGGAVVGAVVTQ